MAKITRSAPRDGDVVVRQEVRAGAPVFVLLTVPGEGQYYANGREEACAQAVAFAKTRHVFAWLTDGPAGFVRLGTPHVPKGPVATAPRPRQTIDGSQGHHQPQVVPVATMPVAS